MLRSLLLAATALAAVTASAQAADLPSARGVPAAPVVYAPIFTWTGFYVGLNAGYGFRNNNDVTFYNSVTGARATYGSGNNGGFVGGGQIGYNWQMGQAVFGVETDIQYADLGRNNGTTFFSGYTFGSRGGNSNYFGTVRGRVGYAFDRALLYVTGGLAYGDVGGNTFWGNSSTKVGWTLGAGMEYAFTNNWTAKVEGLWVNIDRGGRGGGYYAGTPVYVTSGKDNGFAVVRAGLNYKF